MQAVMDNVNMSSSRESGTIVHLSRSIALRDDAPLGRLRSRWGTLRGSDVGHR
jgi:hypothetical protein